MKRLTKTTKCGFLHCTRQAKKLVYDNVLNMVRPMCASHGNWIIQNKKPEYVEVCPNCGCRIPVN